MPFTPPAPPTSSVSLSVTGTGAFTNTAAVVTPVKAGKAKASFPPEEKTKLSGSSEKERLTSNLKQPGRKSQFHGRPPTVRGKGSGAALSGLRVDGRNPWLPCHRLTVMSQRLPVTSLSSSDGSSFPASSSGEFVTPGVGSKPKSRKEEQTEPEEEEQEHFTLTLTPEAVELLQRRSIEKLRTCRLGASQNNTSVPRRTPGKSRPGTTRNTDSSRVRRAGNNGVKASHVSEDISHLLKISLLNDQYRYDDEEYEEEENREMKDQMTIRKCTEWLRGLETATG
ncbi:proline-rich protein 18 [Esox lucius]|uniref:proline-rich protein 18 n=1 Tax=Esox lucius TaxID=8010 RepID=UPI0005766DA7|nr:proline-rich protein 18 [Esox lucius]XP_034150279.1 proline-rich protein 18 [Esox lucius]